MFSRFVTKRTISNLNDKFTVPCWRLFKTTYGYYRKEKAFKSVAILRIHVIPITEVILTNQRHAGSTFLVDDILGFLHIKKVKTKKIIYSYLF